MKENQLEFELGLTVLFSVLITITSPARPTFFIVYKDAGIYQLQVKQLRTFFFCIFIHEFLKYA